MINLDTFRLYVLTVLVLTLLLLVLWMGSAVARSRSKTARNPEDAAAFKVQLVETDPPSVARVLRAHENAFVNIVPFLFLGLIFTMLGGTPTWANVFFGAFVLARIAHAVMYLVGKQPWRTVTFLVGLLTTLGLMVDIVVLVAKLGR